MTQSAQQTFRGKNVPEVMKKVKETFGSDAIIIEKRELKSRGPFYKLGGSEAMVEIVAGVASTKNPNTDNTTNNKGKSLLERTYGQTPSPARAYKNMQTEDGIELELSTKKSAHTSWTENPVKIPEVSNGSSMAIMEQMREEILRMASTQARGGIPAVGENLLDAYQRLIEQEVNPTVAREIVERLQRNMIGSTLDRAAVNTGLQTEIASRIKVGGTIPMDNFSGRPSVVMLLGPSGSGKTTTIIKLAFEAAINHKKKVGLITEDFRRPGAAMQLQNLTQFMDLPLVVVDSPQRMAEEIRNMSDLDLVLVDTGGRGPRDDKGLQELERMISAAKADQTHLVIPCSYTERAASATATAYRKIGFDKIILSKLDEAPTYGLALDIAEFAPEQLSYLTTGQKCSDGLKKADPSEIASLVCDNSIL